jgi:hypothetical protein
MLLVCLCFSFRPGFLALNISPYKALSAALRYPDAQILETHRDLSTRVDVIESGAVHFAPGLSLEFEGKLPEQLGLCLDAEHLNAVTRFSKTIRLPGMNASGREGRQEQKMKQRQNS